MKWCSSTLGTCTQQVERPREELEGFQRVTVDAGQTKTVEIPLPASRLAYWDVKTEGVSRGS